MPSVVLLSFLCYYIVVTYSDLIVNQVNVENSNM